jgi:deoxycytidylate deaminase
MTSERVVMLACRAASRSMVSLWRTGAVLVRGNRVLARGVNKRKTHPQTRHAWSIHAEIDALLRADLPLPPKTTVCVVRLTRSGLLAMSYPCGDCLSALLKAGVTRIVFSGGDRAIHVQDW